MFLPRLQGFLYRNLLKPILFRFDPEKIHDLFCKLGALLGRYRFTRRLTAFFFLYQDASLGQTIHGIRFQNPVGLAAGFDKNAILTQILPDVGFGFEVVGSITGEPCEGNKERPRLWRLPKSKALVVYYGLMNDGCVAIAERLKKMVFRFPVGISVAKTNCVDTVECRAGIRDYIKAMRIMNKVGDFFVINISCPNAFGGEPFSDPAKLELLLAAADEVKTTKPIFLKLPVDISNDELDALIAVCDRHRVHGFILSNLTKNRDRAEIVKEEIAGITKGGISGVPTIGLSNQLIAYAYQTAGDRYTIIGVGGIFSAKDAYEKICAGASLVELITGMIYEGPELIGQINKGLVEFLKRDGFVNLSEAVGSTHICHAKK